MNPQESDSKLQPRDTWPIKMGSPEKHELQPAVAPPVDPALVRSRTKLAAIIAALFLSLFLAALDFTIVSTAIPTIANQFDSAKGYTWIGSAYLLANAASTPLWGKLSDIWGRKPVLLVAVAVFFIGSLICATSIDMGMLIAGRAVQGSASGGLVALVNICISDLFSMRERGFWLGLLSVIWALASGVGPVLGGAFTQLVSWRWIWWINLPCSALTFLTVFFFLDVHNPGTGFVAGIMAVDWFGSLSVVGLAVMFLLGLDFGGITFPWKSPQVVCLIIFGLLMSILFVFSEAKLAKHPIMPLGLFRNRSNIAAFLVTFSHGFTYISALYFLPLYFRSVGLASPLRSGVLILPLALFQSCTGIVAGILIQKTGRYVEIIRTGMVVMTLGFGLFIDFGDEFNLAKVVLFQTVTGLGVGLNFQPPLIALQAHVRQQDVATTTATFGFIRNIATSMSIVIGGVVFQNGMQSQAGRLQEMLGPAQAQKLAGDSAAANVGILPTLPLKQQRAAQIAFASAFRDMWILYVVMSACGIMASALISKKVLDKEHVETRTGLETKPVGEAKLPTVVVPTEMV